MVLTNIYGPLTGHTVIYRCDVYHVYSSITEGKHEMSGKVCPLPSRERDEGKG